MSTIPDDHSLATLLCTELLTASHVKTLCQSRGFPLTAANKDALAQAAAGRFLEPTGVAAAMAALEPDWLRVLHLVAAADRPVSPHTVALALGRLKHTYSGLDYRALWSEVALRLASRGVVLVVDGLAPRGEKSRFARLHLVLPEGFAPLLPPFPIDAEPVQGGGHHGRLDDLLADALEALAEGERSEGGGRPLATHMAACLSVKGGKLRVADADHPDGTIVARRAREAWIVSISVKGREGSEVSPGGLALHMLGTLTAGVGCTAEALATALGRAALEVKAQVLEAWLEDGVAAGFLTRFDRKGGPALFRATEPTPVPEREGIQLEQAGILSRVVPAGTGIVPLLQAATVAHVTVGEGAILLEPDPVRLGRGWHLLPEWVRQALTASSRGFRDAAELVEKRTGQVVVHRGLAVLRVEDAGLRALLMHRLGESVRPLDDRHIACLAGQLAEVLSFTRKEGYVAKRLP
jgi:hypothetical protein